MSREERQSRVNRRDEKAILAVGSRNDIDMLPTLRRIAAHSTPNDEDVKEFRSDKRTLGIRFRDSSFAARAALTKMKAEDHLKDFVAELSTTNVRWKIDVIGYLGYMGDVRAAKHVGPLLFDDSKPFRRRGPVPVVSAVAADAMGSILPDVLKELRRQNPGKMFLLPEWKAWWKANEGKYK